MKRLLPLILIALASTVSAQTKVLASWEVQDGTNFGYAPRGQAIWAELRHHFTKKTEGYIGGSIGNAKKASVGDGTHYSGALGVRYWLRDWVFVIGGANVSADRNSAYSKVALRGTLGAGIRFSDWTVTGTAFAPPGGLVSDANQVKGLNILAEWERRLVGPVSLYAAGQISKASFSQTGDPSQRFTGIIPRGRAGIVVTF